MGSNFPKIFGPQRRILPTKYWVQYGLRYGKSASPIASEKIMDVIPDYGDGVFYLDEDLKTMGIAKKRVV
ncbi:hypothetical protein CRE_17006 [Caenorhabditis remanei]|uniref:Uncharacterized protein n=1 Tax=Caenorhabditis remanei TaxID=31234 RepID=E3N7X8_CAERE|nr:hypothetical protein CRE_17006 [Caenorhabditis remanei]